MEMSRNRRHHRRNSRCAVARNGRWQRSCIGRCVGGTRMLREALVRGTLVVVRHSSRSVGVI